MDQKISSKAESISLRRRRCWCACVCITALWIPLCDCKNLMVYDVVVVFIVFIFTYSDAVVVVFPISHSPDGLLFSRHLLGWRWRHENKNNNNIFFGKWCTADCLCLPQWRQLWVVRRPKSNRTLDARDVRFRFVVEDNLIFRFIVLKEATATPGNNSEICER